MPWKKLKHHSLQPAKQLLTLGNGSFSQSKVSRKPILFHLILLPLSQQRVLNTVLLYTAVALVLTQSNESEAFSCYVMFNCNKRVLSGILVLLRNVRFLSQTAVSHSNHIFPWTNMLIKMSLHHLFLHEKMVLFLRRTQQQVGRNAKVGYGRADHYCWRTPAACNPVILLKCQREIQRKQQAANRMLHTDQLPLFQ